MGDFWKLYEQRTYAFERIASNCSVGYLCGDRIRTYYFPRLLCLWSSFEPKGAGSTVLDLEDFIVSNLLLPIGSLIFLLFCTSKWGWGFDNYLKECNTGKGVKLPKALRFYVTYVIPCIIFIILIMGLR